MRIGTFSKYKGYVGTIEFMFAEYFGKIKNIEEYIMYRGDSLEELLDNFHKVVDDYLLMQNSTRKDNNNMSKAILVLDEMPKNCLECPLGKNMSIAIEVCIKCPLGKCATDEETETIPKWCPLKEITKEKECILNNLI